MLFGMARVNECWETENNFRAGKVLPVNDRPQGGWFGFYFAAHITRGKTKIQARSVYIVAVVAVCLTPGLNITNQVALKGR